MFRKLIRSLAIILVLVCTIAMAGCGKMPPSGITIVGDEIYFTQEGSLYRMNTDDTKHERLARNACFEAISDDWLYYSTYSAKQLYRMRTDGTGREKLSDNEVWGDLKIADGWIYYNDGWNLLFRIKTDGANFEKLSNTEALLFDVVDGWVYYQSEVYCLDRMRVDGTERERLLDDERPLCISDGWIYYDNKNGIFSRMRTDGTDKKEVLDFNKEDVKEEFDFYDINKIIVENDWLYFNNEYQDFSIYRMHADSTECEQIVGSYASLIDVVDGWVYYNDFDDTGLIEGDNAEYNLYRVRTNGTDKQNLYSTSVRFY